MTNIYAPPAFQFYARDWITNTAQLTAEEKGALADLKAYAWLAVMRGEPPCSLPDDDAKLARLSGLGTRWRKVAVTLRAYFRVDGDRLVDHDLLTHRAEREEFHNERSEAGRKGAAARRGTASSSDSSKRVAEPPTQPVAEPLANAQQNSSKTLALQSASASALASASKSGAEAEGLIAGADAGFPHNSNGAAPPAPPADAEADRNTPLPLKATALLARMPDAKRPDGYGQLRAALGAEGARLKAGDYVRAASWHHLEWACAAVLDSPPDKPEQLARWVLLKLRDTFTEWRARDDKRAAATVPPEVTAIVRQAIPTPVDELDASLLWLLDHPEIAKEIDALGAEKWAEFGDSAKVRRQRYDWQDRQGIERWRAAGSPTPLATASTGERS